MTFERVAALYDIHGNLPALEAVLAEVDAAGVELTSSRPATPSTRRPATSR